MKVTGRDPKMGAAVLKSATERASSFTNPRNLTLMAGALVVALIPVVGIALSTGVDRFKNSEVAKEQKQALVNHFREQIAAQVGKADPSKVTVADLDLAVKANPRVFGNLVAKVNVEEERNNRASLMSMGTAYAAGGFIPGLGVVSHLGGAVAGGMASNLFNKEQLMTQDVVEMINQKATQQQPVTSFDIMLLRISQDVALQEQIKKHGKPFHQMSETEQRAVTAALPDLYEAAERDAQALNSGRITEQDLLLSSPGANPIASPQQQKASWSQRVGGPRSARQGTWTQGVAASRTNTGPVLG